MDFMNDFANNNEYRMLIPWDILNILYLYNRNKFVNTCKEFNEKYKNEEKCVNKILKWWDNCCLTYVHQNVPINKYEIMSKRRLVEHYKLNYEWDYLKTYPTFLVNKCNKLDLLEKAKNAELIGTRQSIIDFLKDSNIVKEDILYAGW
tara:strand:- start:78 stop:521 length:444 start_codon:yes stop_codon:yes gene_type:complete